MNIDFHYYATYCAAFIAGHTHEESLQAAFCSQFTDCCSRTFLSRIKAPLSAATTQLSLELADASTDLLGLQDITRIWASFHFLPYDLYAKKKKRPMQYMFKYRLICGPDGDLSEYTVRLAKNRGIQAEGLAMHIIADTWAHRYFAGTPSLVINNTNYHFYELIGDEETQTVRPVTFRHSPSAPDDIDNCVINNSIYQSSENSIMNLGHGRAGHLPDYSFVRYKYLPAWDDYNELIKDNPSDYYNAFCQMIYAFKYFLGKYPSYEKGSRDYEAAEPWKERIMAILRKRQLSAAEDWREFGMSLSGQDVEYFDMDKYTDEYKNAPSDKKDDTFLGRYIIAALAQKSMVTNKIFRSGNPIAGISVDYNEKGFSGIKDFIRLVEYMKESGDIK